MDSLKDGIHIPKNRSRLKVLVYLSGGIVAFAIYRAQFNGAGSDLELIFIGWLFLIALIYGIFRLRKEIPGMIIDEQGIVDHSSDIGKFSVTWSDIRSFEEKLIAGKPYILVHVNDTRKFIDQNRGIKRASMKFNQRMYGTPLCISVLTLKVKGSELFDLLVGIHATKTESLKDDINEQNNN